MTDSANSIAKVAIVISRYIGESLNVGKLLNEDDKEKKKKKAMDRTYWKAKNFR